MNNVEHFKKIATELGELYEVKDRAYGSSFADTYKKLGLISAVTRISDKYNRLCNLATNPDIDNLGESLEDTLRDMASYCIMTVMELENAKPKRVGDDKIREGDLFECIEDVIEDGCIVYYREGGFYRSHIDGCITDIRDDDQHEWGDSWQKYFKRV